MRSTQFLSRDAAVSKTRQAYSYVGGNPLSAADPSGLDACDPYLEHSMCEQTLAHCTADGDPTACLGVLQSVSNELLSVREMEQKDVPDYVQNVEDGNCDDAQLDLADYRAMQQRELELERIGQVIVTDALPNLGESSSADRMFSWLNMHGGPVGGFLAGCYGGVKSNLRLIQAYPVLGDIEYDSRFGLYGASGVACAAAGAGGAVGVQVAFPSGT